MWWTFFKAVRTGEFRLAPMTWIAAAATVIYAVSPVDFISEIVFGPLGLADDLGVWGILFVLVTREKQRWEAQVRHSTINVDGTVRRD